METKSRRGGRLGGKQTHSHLPLVFSTLVHSLRLFSLIPLGLALLTGRRLLTLPQKVHTTSSLLTMTTQLLSTHPLLLVLSPSVLLVSLVLSIPFLTLAFRLLLIGYATHPKGGWEWHVHGWANWAIAGTVGVWIWSWAVARGVLRSSTASVIASWYFSEYEKIFLF